MCIYIYMYIYFFTFTNRYLVYRYLLLMLSPNWICGYLPKTPEATKPCFIHQLLSSHPPMLDERRTDGMLFNAARCGHLARMK